MGTRLAQRTLATVCLLLGLHAGGPGRGAEHEGSARAATATLDRIRAAVDQSRRRLRSIEVEFLARGLEPTTGAPEGATLRRVVAARGTSRYVASVHTAAGLPERLDVDGNLVVYDGRSKVLTDFRPRLSYGEVFRRDAGLFAWKVQGEFFFECTAWRPPDDDSKPPEVEIAFLLHEALADPQCRVLPRQERVDGAWCHVVERPGVDKLWLDPAIGFALRRRHWLHGQHAAPPIDYELSDYREVAPKVWVPWRLRRVTYKPRPHKPGGPLSVDSVAEVALLRAEVNRVPEGRFRVDLPPGTLVWDGDAKSYEQVPGGLPLLDAIIALAEARAEVYAKAMAAGGWGRRAYASNTYPIAVGLLLSALAAALLIYRIGASRARRRADGARVSGLSPSIG
jgi:hypothetical protein